jgi:prepilin-type N-terminal cleavage/methylation domain-containing protein/prepilin-type processing-associated H-X9-DG protein
MIVSMMTRKPDFEPLRRSNGFTLVELLVVIGVIAVLAGLVAPALSRAKDRARLTECRNNLRQWGLGLQMYLDDNRDLYPYFAVRGSVNRSRWYDLLSPYTRIEWPLLLTNANSQFGIHVCPGYRRIGGNYLFAAGSYGYNVAGVAYPVTQFGLGLGGKTTTFTPPSLIEEVAPTRLSDITIPSDMIAIADTSPIKSPSGPLLGLDELNPNTILYWVPPPFSDLPSDDVFSITLRAVAKRHANRWNTLFCDGHVESLKQSGLYELRKMKVAQRWNKDNRPHYEFVNAQRLSVVTLAAAFSEY